MRVVLPAVLSLCGAVLAGTGEPAQQGAPATRLPPGHPGAPVAASWPKARPEDVKSIDAILAAMYTTSGGAPGQPRDWDRYRSLFLPDARMIAARPGEGGAATAMFLTVGNYVDVNRTYFEKGGFFDKEIARRQQVFGNMAQVWSTFESRHSAVDQEPYVRGINSIQLLKDGDRWWIVNLFWDFERPDSPLPDRYLVTPQE